MLDKGQKQSSTLSCDSSYFICVVKIKDNDQLCSNWSVSLFSQDLVHLFQTLLPGGIG